MNDQMIYQLMAKTPDIRAVQIADALDKDLSDVSEALRSLVEVGDVVAHTGSAPNGQPTRLYNLSDEFKRSKDGRALLESVVGAMLAEPVAPALPPAPPFPEPAAAVATPVFATQTEMAPVRTKGAIAIEHLTKHQRNVDPGKRPVNDADMRAVLGLPRTSHPRAYLTAQMKSGTIVRNADGYWSLGDGTPPPPAGQSPSLRNYGSKNKDQPVAQFPATAQPDPASAPPETDLPEPQSTNEEVTMSQPEPKPAPPETEAAPAAEPVFRCGLWSDGVLELQRDGVQVVALNRGEHEQLADFMGRMLGHVDKAAP